MHISFTLKCRIHVLNKNSSVSFVDTHFKGTFGAFIIFFIQLNFTPQTLTSKPKYLFNWKNIVLTLRTKSTEIMKSVCVKNIKAQKNGIIRTANSNREKKWNKRCRHDILMRNNNKIRSSGKRKQKKKQKKHSTWTTKKN